MIFVKSEPTREFLEYCFKQDQDLLDKFHIYSGQGVKACAEKTYLDLLQANVVFYKMYDCNDNLLGWFGKESDNHLTGFFIEPQYRKEVKLNKVLEQFSKPVYTGLYLKNTRAIKAMNKLGFQIIKTITTPDGVGVLMEL